MAEPTAGRPSDRAATGGIMHDQLTIRSFALYAEQRLALGPASRVEDGDIGVRSESRKSSGPQLIADSRSRIRADHEVIAPSVTLGDDVECGRILTDRLVEHDIPLRSEQGRGIHRRTKPRPVRQIHLCGC